jgi:hypothetical protein
MSESGRSGGATWGRVRVVGLLALALLLADWPIGALAQGATCSSFPNQAAAQAALRANPVAMGGLDRDRDGVACESLSCPCDGVATTARGRDAEQRRRRERDGHALHRLYLHGADAAAAA